MGTFFIPIISGIIGAYITYMLSIRKFRTEKWWDLKVSAYQKLINALYEAREYSSNFLDQEMGIKTLSKDREEEITRISTAAHREILKSAEVGSFLFSTSVMARLELYKSNLAVGGDSWFEYLETDYAETNSCLKDIIKIAKEDLEELSLDPIQIFLSKTKQKFIKLDKNL